MTAAIARAESIPVVSGKAASVRVFKQGEKIAGAWLEWDGSILKPRHGATRGLEYDHDLMLSQLRIGLQSTPLCFSGCKLKVVSLIPRVRRPETAITKLLRSAQIASDFSIFEVSCIKRSEYERFSPFLVPGGYPAVTENPSATTLVLIPQNEQISAIIHAHTLELMRISTGRITLVG